MARIAESEIERLKLQVSLERLVESAGVVLKVHGKDKIGRCPFHEDKTPSLVVSPKTNLWHCLGACQAGGSVIDWVMRFEGVSFRHAVELLRNDTLPLAAASPVKQSTVRKLAAPVAFDADDCALLGQVIDYYHATLKAAPEALAYLKTRGIDAVEAIETFKLGYANRTLGLRLPEKNRVAGADIRTRLQRIGLYRETGREHFNGSLVIPVIGLDGEITEVYGRKVRDDLREGTPKHLYLPGPHRGVWNEAALAASKEIILCESLIDALTFWCAGYRNVTTSYGVEGFTADHLAAFQRHGTERVLIAYDRDAAGDAAADKLAAQLIAAGIACYRCGFPKGMDANDYALKVTPASQSLGVVLRSAQWLGNGVPRPITTTAPVREPQVESREEEPVRQESIQSDTPAAGPELPLLAAAPASPLPAAPPADAPCEVREHEIVLTFGERRYRIRGVAKNLSFDLLKVNVMVSHGERFYVDTFDFYAAKPRSHYVSAAAVELGLGEDVLKGDLGRVLLKLEQIQETLITKALQPTTPAPPSMSEADRDAALSLLRDPHLVNRILADFTVCGLIGEDTNKLVGYLAAVSRKLDRPLGIVIQSSSAAGKTTLLDAVLGLLPDDAKVKYSAMTGQSLFYMGETNLKHKVLAIVEEEGASRASYALKLLQSEGELTIASTGKDPNTGNLITQEYRVEGPVALLLTTTARDLDEELLNRCLVLAVDESREQTAAIHRMQRDRRTLDGLIAKRERDAIRALHQNAQRLLRPLEVLNPFARWLTFPDQTTRLRRDHEKYLTLIDTLALLHQHQREIKTTARGEQAIEYIEVTLDDIALANRLAHDVLGRSLDALPPQTRRLLTLIDGYVSAQCIQAAIARGAFRFSRRALREAIAWGDTQLRVHLERLVDLEYLIVHREGAGGRYVYELAYEVNPAEDRAQVAGLIDVATLAGLAATTGKSRGEAPEVAGRMRGVRGPVAGRSRGEEIPASPSGARLGAAAPEITTATHVSAVNGQLPLYPQVAHA